jgi:GNAT superfamily N-acetyltransferase
MGLTSHASHLDPSLSVRRLTSVDTALARQLDELFDEGTVWDRAQGERFLADRSNLLVVAFWDEQARGFASAHRLQRFDRRRAEVLLYEIGVAEPFRTRGIGTALIAEVKRWAAEVGADEVWVLAEATNTPALAFYRATGGEEDTRGAVMFTYAVATQR